ncbi:carbohydrate ABC transporter permease [Pseudooceanicola algae]|uniref:sn-glycerol-3-phosphate transport system permease protein UgpE n=1 Tax=Pseudooceanicola algae TaxID=1537215 RepID=A0A418SKR2_9RHOB|nr:carbohydrate ABC transporter permease [Pseudooceanicola algae]QPM90986.1 L-arabinose transport system permease protein AraQ [Pseudooceanicola algae]
MKRVILLGLLALGAVMVLLPFLWMVSVSLKPQEEIFTASARLVPRAPTLANYWQALTQTSIPRYLLNGVIVTGGILVLQVLVSVPCAYALAHRDFRGRGLLFAAILAALLAPFHVTAIPIFLGLARLGWLNSYAALILPFTATAFGLFLLRQAFGRIPGELIDAARVDGLSEMAIAWRIAFPLAMPTVIAFAIFSVTAHWNDLFWPMIATTDPQLATPPRGILFFRDAESGDNPGPLMAGAVLITAPLVLAFLLSQRRFTQGLANTGLKG